MQLLKKLRKKNDFYVGLVMIGTALVFLLQIGAITKEESRMMPYVIVGVMALTGLVVLIGAILHPEQSPKRIAFQKRELILIGMLIITLVIMKYVGFYCALFLFASACFLFVQNQWDKKSVLSAILYCFILVAFLYLCFTFLLHMSTPRGILF